MIETLVRAPEREECTEVEVMDGPWAADVSEQLASFAVERLEWTSDPAPLDEQAPSPTVEECVQRFARAEADVADPSLDGLGRVSGARVPRLGGLLHGRVRPGGATEAAVRSAVERTIWAGYRAAVLTNQVASVPVHDLDADQLWEALLRLGYRVPRDVASTTWELCAMDELWIEVLEQAGLEREANRIASNVHTALSRSIRGLAAVGVALAIAERGGRRDRREPQLRRRRSPRLHRGGSVPPAPRLAAPTWVR